MRCKNAIFPFMSVIFLLSSSVATSQTPIWGPEVFERFTGAPTALTATFSAPNAEWEYTLRVTFSGVLPGKGGTAQFEKQIASGSIMINGEAVLTPSDFIANGTSAEPIERTISLQAENEIVVLLASSPGAKIALEILGPSMSSKIGLEGGTVEIEGVASLVLPQGSFQADTDISLFASESSETRAVIDFSSILYSASLCLPYELTIQTGTLSPDSSCDITIVLPQVFLNEVEENETVRILAQIYQDGGEEVLDEFEVMPSLYDPATGTVTATLPRWAFTDLRNENGIYEAIVVAIVNPRTGG